MTKKEKEDIAHTIAMIQILYNISTNERISSDDERFDFMVDMFSMKCETIIPKIGFTIADMLEAYIDSKMSLTDIQTALKISISTYSAEKELMLKIINS